VSELPINEVVCGDAVELMRGLPSGSIHAIVTDPPYGLEFMGEEWDKFKADGSWNKRGENWHKKFGKSAYGRILDKAPVNWAKAGIPYQQWTTAWAREALRVLLPGASMLAMGGTRTHHRMACGIEDAGFEIKDTILWCYNSGFPKAQNLGKMIDKRLGAEREVIRLKQHSDNFERAKLNKIGYLRDPANKNNTKCFGYGVEKITLPSTEDARKWDGWKVGGLKPSYEPIVWAVKPPEGPYTENVLKHGVGGINVDACRIPYESEDDKESARFGHGGLSSKISPCYHQRPEWDMGKNYLTSQQGRYPANMVRTDRFGDGYDRFYFVPKADRAERDEGLDGMPQSEIEHSVFDRCAKCGGLIINKGKRPSGCTCDIPTRVGNKLKNIHPTVKPVCLMEHLIKLVTREGQIVLDPFVGSGTTCIAARNLLRCYIGIDNNAEYCEIAKRRLAAIPQPLEAYA